MKCQKQLDPHVLLHHTECKFIDISVLTFISVELLGLFHLQWVLQVDHYPELFLSLNTVANSVILTRPHFCLRNLMISTLLSIAIIVFNKLHAIVLLCY